MNLQLTYCVTECVLMVNMDKTRVTMDMIYFNINKAERLDCKCGLFIVKSHVLLTIEAQWSPLLFRNCVVVVFSLFTLNCFVNISFLPVCFAVGLIYLKQLLCCVMYMNYS